MTTKEYNAEAAENIKALNQWADMADFRQLVMMMYLHTVESDDYAKLSHLEQRQLAKSIVELTKFFERAEVLIQVEIDNNFGNDGTA